MLFYFRLNGWPFYRRPDRSSTLKWQRRTRIKLEREGDENQPVLQVLEQQIYENDEQLDDEGGDEDVIEHQANQSNQANQLNVKFK